MVSIGTLKRQKRYEVLVQAVSLLPARVTLDLIGDGSETDALKQLAASLGISDRVAFHGPLYEPAAKAAVLSSGHIGVIPGRGGLAIQEMMAHGLPVISGVADGTEQDLIRDRQTGYLIDGFPTAEQIADRMRAFIALPPPDRAAMARGALAVVVAVSNTGTMAQGIADAVTNTLHDVPAASAASELR